MRLYSDTWLACRNTRCNNTPRNPAILIAGNYNRSPAWSLDGKQLYYLRGNEAAQNLTMMVVDIAEGNPSPARVLIDPWPTGATAIRRMYDLLEDGTFLTALNIDEQNELDALRQRNAVDEIQIILNFFDLLRERLGVQ